MVIPLLANQDLTPMLIRGALKEAQRAQPHFEMKRVFRGTLPSSELTIGGMNSNGVLHIYNRVLFKDSALS